MIHPCDNYLDIHRLRPIADSRSIFCILDFNEPDNDFSPKEYLVNRYTVPVNSATPASGEKPAMLPACPR